MDWKNDDTYQWCLNQYQPEDSCLWFSCPKAKWIPENFPFPKVMLFQVSAYPSSIHTLDMFDGYYTLTDNGHSILVDDETFVQYNDIVDGLHFFTSHLQGSNYTWRHTYFIWNNTTLCYTLKDGPITYRMFAKTYIFMYTFLKEINHHLINDVISLILNYIDLLQLLTNKE